MIFDKTIKRFMLNYLFKAKKAYLVFFNVAKCAFVCFKPCLQRV